MKTCAVIFAINNYKDKFPFWYYNSINSFKKWHPDIELRVIEDRYTFTNDCRFMFQCVYDLMSEEGYERVIKLDSDGIVCGRFDDILNDETNLVITTSGSNYSDIKNRNQHQRFCLPERNILEHSSINAGIYSITGLETAKFLLDYSIKNQVSDESALNMINQSVEFSGFIRIIDFPYSLSKNIYNLRFHCMSDFHCIKPEGVSLSCDENSSIVSYVSPFNRLFVYNGMLLNHDGKQIKFFHNTSHAGYHLLMSTDQHVKDFFTNQCNCNLKLPHIINK